MAGRGVAPVLLGVCLGAAAMLLADTLRHARGNSSAVDFDGHQIPAGPSRRLISGQTHVAASASIPARQRALVKPAEPVEPVLKSAEFTMGESTLQRDQRLRAAPLNTLLSSNIVRCDFDPGAGAYWSEGTVHTHGVSYSGGQIVYQSIDIENGTAQMTGMPGPTGSTSGELDVRVTANNAGIHFAGFTPAGSLIVTSVYATVDQSGRYSAVMSRHGQGAGHESIQVYGTCDIRLSK